MGQVSVDESLALLPSIANSSFTSPSPLVVAPKRALLVCKRTRWEYERSKMSLCVGDECMERRLAEKEIDGRGLRAKHEAQKEGEKRIVSQLKKAGVSTTRVDLSSLPRTLPPVDIVIAAGGDGTFLAAASLVNDSTPVVGINTDPLGSEGHLCVGGKNPPVGLVSLLTSLDTKWTLRSRIAVRVEGAKGRTTPILALNDVFIGETDSAKVSYYDISIDGSAPQRQKSSGMVVCSGTGSSAWFSSITRVHSSTAEDVLRALSSLGISLPSSPALAEAVAEKVNEELSRPIDSSDLYFAIREPIFNHTFHPTPTRGKATRISLSSRCSNAVVVVDGTRSFPFDFGSRVTIEISDNHSLRTLL